MARRRRSHGVQPRRILIGAFSARPGECAAQSSDHPDAMDESPNVQPDLPGAAQCRDRFGTHCRQTSNIIADAKTSAILT